MDKTENSRFQIIKLLQKRTGASLQVCKKALDESENDIDKAILFLRENNLVQAISKKELIKKCSDYAIEWAESFLELTFETGELQQALESGELDTIQENYYNWYIVGHRGSCPYLTFEKELQFLTDRQKVEPMLSLFPPCVCDTHGL